MDDWDAEPEPVWRVLSARRPLRWSLIGNVKERVPMVVALDAHVDRPEPAAGVWTRFSRDAREGWRRSAFGGLPRDATELLLASAQETVWPTGNLPEVSADHDTILMLVVSGLVRTYRMSGTRQVTTRYASDSDFVGIPAAIRNSSSANGEVLVEVRALRLAPSHLRSLVRRDAAAAWFVMQELVNLHDAAVHMACDNVFLPVRQRVARHLLDLAVRDPEGLVVSASHQDIADAIGSVREVVSRVMRELRAESAVQRSGNRIVLTRPADLHRISAGRRATG